MKTRTVIVAAVILGAASFPAGSQEPTASVGGPTRLEGQVAITRLGAPVDIEQVVRDAEVNKRRAEEASASLQSSKAEMERLTQELAKKAEALKNADSREAGKTAVKTWLETNLKDLGGKVYMNGDIVVVSLPKADYPLGEMRPSKELSEMLKVISQTAVKFASEFDLTVEGHADRTPVKSNKKYRDNWDVGYARAYAAAKEIRRLASTEKGLAITTRGSELPSSSADPRGDRRVQFLFVSKRQEEAKPVATPKPEATPKATPEATPQTNKDKNPEPPKSSADNAPSGGKPSAFDEGSGDGSDEEPLPPLSSSESVGLPSPAPGKDLDEE